MIIYYNPTTHDVCDKKMNDCVELTTSVTLEGTMKLEVFINNMCNSIINGTRFDCMLALTPTPNNVSIDSNFDILARNLAILPPHGDIFFNRISLETPIRSIKLTNEFINNKQYKVLINGFDASDIVTFAEPVSKLEIIVENLLDINNTLVALLFGMEV